MTTLRQIAIAIIAMSLLLSAETGTKHALAQSDTNHAGLVVAFPDGSARTYCIPFAQPEISGLDLLVASGLDVKVQAYGGLGAEICEIGSAGCDYPNQACACQSYGPNGVYWSYFHLQNGTWKASIVGAGSYKVHNGDVDGWAFTSGKPPTLYTFAQLCPAVAPQSTPTNTVAAPQPPTPKPTPRPPANTPARRPPLPSPTPRRVTPTAQSAHPQPTTVLLSPTPTESVAPKTTATLTPSRTAQPAATSTLTIEPSPTSTIMTPPTDTATIPAPAGNAQLASPNSEDTARNVGVIVGAIALGSLAVWGVARLARKERNAEGDDVE